jgi:transcriptional regulator with XRE-family HTH domain
MSGDDPESAHEVLKKFSLEERRNVIRKFRKELKLSQTEFAALAGIGPSMLSRFENGNRDLSAEAFARVEDGIVEALAQRERKPVPLADLLDPEKTKKMFSRASPIDAKAIVRQAREELARKEAKDPDFRRVSAMCRNLFADNQKLHERISELKGRIDLLSDLLDVKTKEVRLREAAEGEDMKEKLER